MKQIINILVFLLISGFITNCNPKQNEMKKIIFLHHSTGQAIWYGKVNRYVRKLTDKSDVKTYFNKYNRKFNAGYKITEQSFPKGKHYGWTNFPYDYYNIWVKNAGTQTYMEEPTLEILTKEYEMIIFKHCYPVSNILEDTGMPDIDSDIKRLENYKLQYNALKQKIHEFPQNKFIIWTPAAKVEKSITPEEAQRTREFHSWIINEWDEKGDNIYIWDFYNYETEGGLYLKNEYAASVEDSHPNKQFAGRVAPLFAQFIIDVEQEKIE